MAQQSFTGSTGLLDVPAPEWIAGDEALFSYWGMALMTMVCHGQIKTLRAGEAITLSSRQLGLMIDGGIYTLDEQTLEERSLFVHFLRRGDWFKAMEGPAIDLQFVAHARSTVLIVDDASFDAFMREFSMSERLVQALDLQISKQYAAAAQTVGWKDQARLIRTIQMLAQHPTAPHTKLGREIESSKQNIRRLAGVQKRSATRAFNAMEKAGVVTFYGYKRVFYKDDQHA